MRKYLELYFIILACQSAFSQVNNDSCLSATELQPSYGENAISCFTGVTGFDVRVFTSNINSVPNLPYPAMTNCKGYSNSTSSYANDVWFKLKTKGFLMYVYSGINGLDTVHLNVWHGNNCLNLKPSGCFTFDLVNQFDHYAEFCADTINDEYTYLQFSGNDIGKLGDFGFCIKGLPCFFIWYYGTTGTNKDSDFLPLDINPNPLINQALISIPFQMHDVTISVYNSQGKLVRNSNIRNLHNYILDRGELDPGLYFVIIAEKKTGEKISRSIMIAN